MPRRRLKGPPVSRKQLSFEQSKPPKSLKLPRSHVKSIVTDKEGTWILVSNPARGMGDNCCLMRLGFIKTNSRSGLIGLFNNSIGKATVPVIYLPSQTKLLPQDDGSLHVTHKTCTGEIIIEAIEREDNSLQRKPLTLTR